MIDPVRTKNRLTYRFDKSANSNISKIINLLSSEFNAWLAADQAIDDARNIDTATGFSLDQIALRFGEVRQGKSDEDLRTRVRIRRVILLSGNTLIEIRQALEKIENVDVNSIEEFYDPIRIGYLDGQGFLDGQEPLDGIGFFDTARIRVEYTGAELEMNVIEVVMNIKPAGIEAEIDKV